MFFNRLHDVMIVS